ncbi:MAG: arginine--tRNA ligase [Candidatus Moranbacteria bacterium]|jgi:arginyl-tRNA synthetase|nr:arginine--tRNA ligase [Candidatus Moranbacteria bacterium]MDD5651853.1 arginine--tRNA ligase [Candidatus Moranbacteria bacterium]MDX9855335.1 arginine--tRNA ligase [Candidatus Moranbacteria bacterium]
MKNRIKEILKEIVKKKWRDFDVEKIEVSYPSDEKFGDFTTNVSMMLANFTKKDPIEIAEQIKEDKSLIDVEDLAKIEIVHPGYINFYLSNKYFAKEINDILKKDKEWGKLEINSGKKYLFEHSSPNLFKPFHIGHLVNNSIGESLVRILKKSGTEVMTLSFPSDVSPGIAKTVWAIKNKGWENDMTIGKIGEAYVFGTAKYNEDEGIKKEVDEINHKIYGKGEFEEKDIYEKGQKISLDYFRKITKRLGSDFDDLIFESEAEKAGKEVVEKNIPSVFEKSDGAVIFPGSKYGLFDNVFINSNGFGTYLAKDIGLLKIKFEKFDFDKSITITDVEQKDHFRLVEKSAELINKDWSEKSEFIQHGRLNFVQEKISSRYGNVPLAEDLIRDIKEKVFDKIKDHDLLDNKKNDIAEKIAVGALKYSILKSSTGKNIIFDFNKSIAFEGDSGPYLQYTYVRARSILRNVQDVKNVKNVRNVPTVGKNVLKFPQAIEMSLKNYSPHHIANFLFELASEFNSFYSHTKVLDEENPNYGYNLALTQAVAITLKNGLDLLGIETVEKM